MHPLTLAGEGGRESQRSSTKRMPMEVQETLQVFRERSNGNERGLAHSSQIGEDRGFVFLSPGPLSGWSARWSGSPSVVDRWAEDVRGSPALCSR